MVPMLRVTAIKLRFSSHNLSLAERSRSQQSASTSLSEQLNLMAVMLRVETRSAS